MAKFKIDACIGILLRSSDGTAANSAENVNFEFGSIITLELEANVIETVLDSDGGITNQSERFVPT
jgi:hypothetical protein